MISSPKSIKKLDEKNLSVVWNDGNEYTLPLKLLRDECPCAECTDAHGTAAANPLGSLQMFVADKYVLKALNKVGNYAVEAEWGDGHSIGIYSWDILKSICEKINKDNN